MLPHDEVLTPGESAQPQTWFEQYRLVILAVAIALVFHGGLLMMGTYRGTYDAYVHIFFADHYARSWWNPWEPRWYTGFTMVSYPPLTHQLTALLSKVTSLPGGFSIVMLTASMMTIVGVYRFSRLWVPHRPAAYAALLAAVSSSIAETVHVFGQLPTMFVMGVMLNALPFVWRWAEDADLKSLLRGWALLMMAAAGHHVTTLFGMVFFSGPILATVLLRKFHTPRAAEPELEPTRFTVGYLPRLVWRRLRRVAPAGVRIGVFGVGLIAILVITVLPYWLWSRSDPITQITIPHSSRDSFLVNTAAGLMFFLIPWGVLLLIFPYALYKGFGSPNWLLAGSLAALALLGTGGTTPIPAMLLRGSFYILTLDRFTFWATIVILPFAGLFVESLLHGRLGRWIGARFGIWWRNGFAAALALAFIGFALFTANLTQFRKFQPAPVDMTPIVEFLAKDSHDSWRYLTLGFGDQMAWLSAQTTALNVEGNYHSARRLPELTSTPIERLDGAKFTAIPGLGSLQQFVTNPQRYNLKYAFVNDDFYEPLLFFAGWHSLGSLDNDVQVWERADVPPLPAAVPVQVYPAWQRFMWGALPVGSLFVAAFAFLWTSVIVPRFRLSLVKVPLLGWLVRRWFIHFWLLNDDRRPPQPASEDWQFWKRLLRRVFPGLRLNPLPRRHVYGAVLLGLLLAGAGAGALLLRREVISPERIILAYYDDIDFKRFSASYRFLDTTLTREEYLRWLSLQGGLLASFAKLDNLDIEVTPAADNTARAQVTAEWLTALGTYVVEDEWQMRHTAEGWRLRLEAEAPAVPRETFLGTTGVDFYLDLPLTTLDETALARGVLDRSMLSAAVSRVVYNPDTPISFTPEPYDAARVQGRFSGMISVLGAVSNRSSAPAHITVTAILRGANNVRLAETNAMDAMLHQLLPGEVTPFRVDFFGADAAQILDIESVEAVEVIVRGVPTAYNLARPIVLLAPRLLYNSGSQPIDIPHLLISHLDADDSLVWIDSLFLERALPPDRTQSFEPPPLPRLDILDIPITLTGPRLLPWTDRIPPVTIHGYTR